MRSAILASTVLIAACVSGVGLAEAGVKVSAKSQNYEISGETGAALLDQMDRRGPKHGFLTRAIAQTSYSLSWTFEWAETAKSCRVKKVDGILSITYTYPAVKQLSPALQGRWKRFVKGVKRHESVHGVIARQMARAIERSVARVEVPGDRGCRNARAETKRIMKAVSIEYEARQNSFDAREHRDGGPVERLIDRLIEN